MNFANLNQLPAKTSRRAMMDYFKPLMSRLEEQNKGRPIGW
jgi:hypothetical protein